MKTSIILSIIILFLFSLYAPCQVIDPVKKIHKKGLKEANKAIDKGINKAFEKPEEEKPIQKEANKEMAQGDSLKDPNKQPIEEAPQLLWSKYDFVPGDRIIFEDDLLGEENGEFPSRWDLKEGNTEIAQFGGENVIMFRDDHPTIMPYMADPKQDYLPEIFTIEFDLYCGTDYFYTYLYDRKYQQSGSPSGYTSLTTTYKRMEFGSSASSLPNEKQLEKRRWIHVAISYNKGKLKAYLDDTRLINIPRIDFDPKGLSLHSYSCSNDHLYYVKNIRIAEGGMKYYDRILQDGKIIATGLRFDVAKATLKPESMGIINEVVEMMQQYPDLKFSIEGHTDSDGDELSNLKLSEERAKTVKKAMEQMGIAAERLEIKGYGEGIPLNANNSPEGKANNRRVEFVKI